MISNRARRQLFLRVLVLAVVFGAVTCGTLRTKRNGWNKRWGPLVPHKTFPSDCGLCHVPDRWDVLKDDFGFDHKKETGVTLEGAHATAACLRCHNDFGPVQVYVERGCSGCHADIHQARLGADCEKCHTQRNWHPEGLVAEHARTSFPLVGAHLAAACENCHVRAPTGDYRGTPTQCEFCHQDDLARATSPDHMAQDWTRDCGRCHFPTGWSGAAFIHNFFPLTGGHGGLDCTRCHAPGDFGGLSTACVSCHVDDFQRAPDHVALGFPQTCEDCHTIQTWQGATFPHTFFPLSGGHSGLDCARCHTSGTVGPLPTACISCHADDFQRAPDHVDLNFPQTCEDCHTIQTWDGANFSHSFPLRGDHNVDCTVCHDTGSTQQFTCIVCHDHNQTKMDDKHDEVSGYAYQSSACLQCHPSGKD